MVCEAVEYHPYAACLMFKQCLNSETVRANLQAVRDDSYHQGRVAGLTFAAEQAGKGAELWDAGMKPREAEALREFQRWLQGKAQQAQEGGVGDGKAVGNETA